MQLKNIAAIAAMLMGAAAMPSMLPMPNLGPRRRPGKASAPRAKSGGKHYPDQSSRQAMRGFRRAQGGPGIELVDGVYRAKEAA